MNEFMIPLLLAAALTCAGGCKAPPLPAPDGDPVVPEVVPPLAAPTGGFEIADSTVDAGTVERGEWATHVFSITNKSDRVMHIKNVRGT